LARFGERRDEKGFATRFRERRRYLLYSAAVAVGLDDRRALGRRRPPGEFTPVGDDRREVDRENPAAFLIRRWRVGRWRGALLAGRHGSIMAGFGRAIHRPLERRKSRQRGNAGGVKYVPATGFRPRDRRSASRRP